MSLQTIGPTSGIWSKKGKNGKRCEATYRVDERQSLEEYNTLFVPVIHWRCEGHAEQQTAISPWPTRDCAAWAAERILAQLGYQQEGAL
jgi:hypothetical protein